MKIYDGMYTLGPQVSLEASLKKANNMVGEQITAEQLIEKRKVMMISKAMIMNIGITSVSSRPTLHASTTITPHIDRYPTCIQSIKFIKNGVMP